MVIKYCTALQFLRFFIQKTDPIFVCKWKNRYNKRGEKNGKQYMGRRFSLKEREAWYRYYWLMLIDNRCLLDNDDKVIYIYMGIVSRSRLIKAD